jgi:diketogulonate reductase-like aldo/keto reductase
VDSKTEQISVIDVPISDTWKAMEALVEKGKVRSIGVSNFTQKKIEKLLKTYVDLYVQFPKVLPASYLTTRQGNHPTSN